MLLFSLTTFLFYARGGCIGGAVEKIGALLAEHFPIKPYDTDELQNVIVEKCNPYIPKGMDLSS